MAPMTRIAVAVMVLLSLSFATSNAACTTGGNECGTHGTCKDNNCECNPGYKGETCTDFDCATCTGNRTCNADNAQCKCKDGFTDTDTCKLFDCSKGTSPCANNGECKENSKVCSCKSGYTGFNCENFDCANCKGNRTCNDASKECKCKEGFTDADTCKIFDCTKGSSLCANNGECDQNSKVCTCKSGYTGFNCETAKPKSSGTRTALYSIGLPVMTTLLLIILQQ